MGLDNSNLDRIQQTIGGSDLSVFYLSEVYRLIDVITYPNQPWFWTKDLVMTEMDSVLSVSYSVLREVFAVRKMGNARAAGFTRGGISINGHLAFTVFSNDVLERLRSQASKAANDYVLTENPNNVSRNMYDLSTAYKELVTKNLNKATLLTDLDPFDILIMGTNESGLYSKMIIKGVRIIDENQYQGIQQPNIVNKVTFSAADLVPMTSGNFNTSNKLESHQYRGSQLFSGIYKQYFNQGGK